MQNNVHLTLSNIIKNQDSVLGLVELFQKQILLGFNVETKLLDNTIYKYPLNTIHHSLIDFLPAVEFNKIIETEYFQLRHRDLIEKIILEIERKDCIKDKTIIIKSIYKNEKSVAVEAFPSQDILKFASDIAVSVKTGDGFPKVKGLPPEKPEKFAINIIRFFRQLSVRENQVLDERVSELTKGLEKKPIEFELKKLSLVVSDDYLSNPNPEIKNFNI